MNNLSDINRDFSHENDVSSGVSDELFRTLLKMLDSIPSYDKFDKSMELIKINNRKTTSKFYDVEKFNSIYQNYISEMIHSGASETVPSNNLQCLKSLNSLYLDGDFMFDSNNIENVNESILKSACIQMAEMYLLEWKRVIADQIDNKYDYYIFIPTTFKNKKGGFHIMIITDENIPTEIRTDMYKTIQESSFALEFYNEYRDYLVYKTFGEFKEHYEKFFDFGTIKTATLLLPFAQKEIKSRKYYLHDYDRNNMLLLKAHGFYGVEFDLSDKSKKLTANLEALDSINTDVEMEIEYAMENNGNINVENENSSPVRIRVKSAKQKMQEMLELDEDNEDIGVSEMEMINESTNNMDYVEELTELELGKLEELANELDSDVRKYSNSNFVNLGRTGVVIAEFMNSLLYLAPEHIFWNKLSNNEVRMRQIITPLIQFVFVNYFIESSGKHPPNEKGEFVHGLTMMILPLLKEVTMRNGDSKETSRHTYTSCYQHIKTYYNKYSGTVSIFDDKLTNFWRQYLSMGNKEKKEAGQSIKINLGRITMRFNHAYASWSNFITKIIMNGFTNELLPFKQRTAKDGPKTKIRSGIGFKDVLPKNVATNPDAVDEKDTYYYKVLKMWTLMFLFMSFYNTKSNLESIRAVLTTYIRWFITDQNGKLYIYNVHQIKDLLKYPYNQWVQAGNKGELVLQFVIDLYRYYVEPELQTSAMITRLEPMLKNLNHLGLNLNGRNGTLRILENYACDMEKVCKNIVSSYKSEYYNPPEFLDPAKEPYFPMRNGLLYFIRETGEYQFLINNRNRLMNGYTNVIWEDNYDYNCVEYNKVKTMFEQIYPMEDEREYILRVMSSVLFGCGTKDLLLILHGGGADGKTTMANAISYMLGHDGAITQVMENGKLVTFENPCGLAGTMKTEVLLSAAKVGHDSDGLIRIKGKRICAIEEPDPGGDGKINCSIAKRILSNTEIVAREIFEKACSFAPNCLLLFSTNIMLSYNEITHGMKRRTVVVHHRAKFSTDITKDGFSTLKHNHTADGQIKRNMVYNPKYRPAEFNLLLPYAQQVLKDNLLPISNIKRPKYISDSTEDSFSDSSGIVGWMIKNIIESPGKAVCLSAIVETAKQCHRETVRENGGLFETRFKNSLEQTKEMHRQLIATFIGKIYKLSDTSGAYIKNNRDVNKDFIIDEQDNNHELIAKYFEHHAISGVQESKVRDKSDLYIIGYEINRNN